MNISKKVYYLLIEVTQGKKSYLGLITHESIHWVSYGGNDVGAFPQRHVIKL